MHRPGRACLCQDAPMANPDPDVCGSERRRAAADPGGPDR
jgi:hypothetical protein